MSEDFDKLSPHLLKQSSDRNDDFSPSFCSLILFLFQEANIPIEITNIIGRIIYNLGFHPMISCGYNHTVALTNTGHVYLWGRNIFYKIVNDVVIQSIVPPIKINIEEMSHERQFFV